MKENGVLIIIIGILIICVLVAGIRLHQYRKQLRLFTKTTRQRLHLDYNSPIKTFYFNKDIVELANALNEYTDMQKELIIEYTNDKKQLKNVIAGISHDFRTPLTAGKGYLQLIDKSKKLTGKEREFLQIAITKMDYLKKLSDDFFELSALEANEEILLEAVHLNPLMEECLLGQYNQIANKGIRFDINFEGKDLFVLSNSHFLNRILENICSNIQKYAVTYVDLAVYTRNDSVLIQFKNDIECDELIEVHRIFEPFYREASRHKEGSGLGLYVVKCLADKLNHQVTAGYENGVFQISLSIPLTKKEVNK